MSPLLFTAVPYTSTSPRIFQRRHFPAQVERNGAKLILKCSDERLVLSGDNIDGWENDLRAILPEAKKAAAQRAAAWQAAQDKAVAAERRSKGTCYTATDGQTSYVERRASARASSRDLVKRQSSSPDFARNVACVAED